MSSNGGFEIIFSPKAEKEFLDSIEWYEENLTNLGLELKNEVKRVLEIIEQNPYTFQIKKLDIREAHIKTFPYLIIYKIYHKKKEVFILSVFHTSRNPVGKHKR
jgi:plasmid stabilization system protein ParE